MSTWTTAARQELASYFERLTPSLKSAGADPAEVIEDLRQHLDREVAAEQLTVVTEADVRRLLARIGAPQPEAPSAPASASAANVPAPPDSGTAGAKRLRPGIWLLLSGVVLPAITWMIEVATGMCAGAFFDPMPTLGHVLVVALVPVVNGLCWSAARAGGVSVRRWLAWANGAAIGVAAFYALQFLPLLLPGLPAIIVLGWGLLPWAPMLSLVAAVFLRGHLRRVTAEAGAKRLPALWPAAVAACVVLVAFDAPVWATRIGLNRAVSEDPAVRNRGLALLRNFGDHDALLRSCYGRNQRAAQMDLVGLLLTRGREPSAEQAREVYYRVMGRPFNAVPPPVVRTGRGTPIDFDDWTWDPEQGGEQVGGRIRGLSVTGSRLDVVVEADAALAYCEWVIEFRNEARQAHEARAQILLPPGGVVSRLTLWVNGEEREAAFSSRSQTRQAYQSVAIRQRRDPVLVTTAGPDRVLMQCFPVPANGGAMKVRLGITAPLDLVSLRETRFQWPCFIERNFSVPEGFRHALWLDTADAVGVKCAALSAGATGNGGRQTVRGELTDAALGAGGGLVQIQRNPEVREVWTPDGRVQPPQVVRANFGMVPSTPASRLVLVVDGSVSMRDAAKAVAEAVAALPDSTDLELYVAFDEVRKLGNSTGGEARRTPKELAGLLAGTGFRGGHDNLAGLAQGWDAAASRPGSVLIWIHGPQPVVLGAPEVLRQRCERAANGPLIYSFQVAAGPNRLLERLDDLPRLRSVARAGSVLDDLTRLFTRLTQSSETPAVRRAVVDESALPAAVDRRQASFHLARLWALDKIRELRGQRRADAEAQALQLAGWYQLVTPVSGAVVLETEEQFRRFDLQAVAKGTTPSMPAPGLEVAAAPPMLEVAAVPEPGTIALFALGAVGLGMGWRHRRRRRNGRQRCYTQRCGPVSSDTVHELDSLTPVSEPFVSGAMRRSRPTFRVSSMWHDRARNHQRS